KLLQVLTAARAAFELGHKTVQGYIDTDRNTATKSETPIAEAIAEAKKNIGENPRFSVNLQRISVETKNVGFDFGTSPELFDILGLGAFQNEFNQERFYNRHTLRRFLNEVVRDNAQEKLEPYSLANYIITKENILHSRKRGATPKDYTDSVNALTETTPDSLFPATAIHAFKTLFMEERDDSSGGNKYTTPSKLQLTDTTTSMYQMYMVFLQKHLKTEYTNVALATMWRFMEKNKTTMDFYYRTFFPQYLRVFYSGDALFKKHFLDTMNVHEVNLIPCTGLDAITFALWICATEMPMGKPVVAVSPPRLNPMSQFWIYTNIIKESVVNGGFQKLLAMGTTDSA
ncbi:MAG: hypothetical protein H7836_17715, partial [Magnetococcus sp. YQC-3]